MRLISTGTLGLALASVLATLACEPSLSSPAAAKPASAVVAAASAVDGRVRIDARFRKSTSGTFTTTGAVSERGSFTASRRVTSGRLQLVETLRGANGTIRVRVVRPCAGGPGTWRVLAGSGAYRGMTGGGTTGSGPRCVGTAYPVIAVHAGTVRIPAPPPPPLLAQPGRFGGGTSQRREVVLTVDAGGRTVSGLRLAVDAPCTGPTALSTTQVTFSFPEPHEIGPEGRFSIPSPTSWWTGIVSGRFTSRTAVQGTATVSTQITSSNTTYPCSANVTWSASIPPPAATPGRYCGFTLQGPGVCFDVAASGREVTHFESAVVVRCFPGGAPPSEIEVSLTYTGSVPIGGHLGFASARLPVQGLISGTASFSGLLETSGATASGTVSLGPATLDYEGTRYTCFSATGRWEARRQA